MTPEDRAYAAWFNGLSEEERRAELKLVLGFDPDPLYVPEEEPRPTHIYLPWVVNGHPECVIPWCKAPPEAHPRGPQLRRQRPRRLPGWLARLVGR